MPIFAEHVCDRQPHRVRATAPVVWRAEGGADGGVPGTAVQGRREGVRIGGTAVSADGQDAIVATITEAGKILGIPRITLYRWLREGFITGEQVVPAAPWHIRIDQALRDKIQSQAPDGWLPVDQAAKALGLSRTTVFQKVRDGQLPAIHVNNGQRRSLRVQVKHEAPGLFDTPK